MDRVLFYQPGGLGDSIFSLPLLKSFRKQHPQAEMDALVVERTAWELYVNQFDFKTIYIIPNKLWLFLKIPILLKRRYSLFLTPTGVNPLSASLLGALLAIGKRVGESRPNQVNFYTVKVTPDYSKHAVESNLDIVRAVGAKPAFSYPTVHVDLEVQNRIKSNFGIKDNDKYVGIHVGCQKKMSYKRWNKNKFTKIIQNLHKNNYRVILLGGNDEISDVREIAMKSRTNPIIAAGKTTLVESIALINCCNLLISNDSGLVHIADGLGVFVIAIFGPTDPVRWGPFKKHNKVVKTSLSCSPCYEKGEIKCKSPKCIEEISVQDVWNTVMEVNK